MAKQKRAVTESTRKKGGGHPFKLLHKLWMRNQMKNVATSPFNPTIQ